MRPSLVLASVDAEGAVFHDEAFNEVRVGCDAVVLVTHRHSNERLYLEPLACAADLDTAGITALYRVGDCVAPQNLSEAIFSGHRLAREIDEAEPAIPLPVLRR